jgi:hypothetical protein
LPLPIAPADAAFLDGIPASERRESSASKLASEIRGLPPPPPPTLARVWLAVNEVDKVWVDQAKEKIREVWNQACEKREELGGPPQNMMLRFYDADFDETTKSPGWAGRYHGIALVDGSNDPGSLHAQIERIDLLQEILQRKCLPGLFVVPPRGAPRIKPDDWSILHFSGDGAGWCMSPIKSASSSTR